MSDAKPPPVEALELEVDPVFEWRRAQLRKAGFGGFASFRLAASKCDYRDPIRALRAGATEERILDLYLDD